MAQVAVIMKVVPGSPDADFSKISEECVKIIKDWSEASEVKIEEEPLAFGLKAIKLIFLMDEKKGDTDPLESLLQKVDGAQTIETADVRRAFG
tara:strand:+ start:1742 stop:2020 length:279 start_codon:yes stop_codon:yes gene_type:complete